VGFLAGLLLVRRTVEEPNVFTRRLKASSSGSRTSPYHLVVGGENVSW